MSIYLLSGRDDVLRHFTDPDTANAALAEERKRDKCARLMTVEQALDEIRNMPSRISIFAPSEAIDAP